MCEEERIAIKFARMRYKRFNRLLLIGAFSINLPKTNFIFQMFSLLREE